MDEKSSLVLNNNNENSLIKNQLKKNFRFYYVSDIHMDELFNNNMNTADKINKVDFIVKKILEGYKKKDAYLLIAGDLVRDINIAKIFYENLIRHINPSQIIVILGNHECYDKKFVVGYNAIGLPIFDREKIVESYEKLFANLGINFLDDDLLIVKKNEIEKLKTEDILLLDGYELKEYCKDNEFLVFGSEGDILFLNNNQLSYDNISYEPKGTFRILYNKLTKVFRNERLICLTHWPNEFINPTFQHETNWIYVHGHTHENYFIDNERKTIYADNQIVNPKYTKLKVFDLNKKKYKNYFSMYENGIHKISNRQYLNLYANNGLDIDFNNKVDDVYLVKKDRFVMFFLKSKKFNKFYLLEGGSVRNIENQDLEYYYENISNYSEKIIEIIEPYQEIIDDLSKEVSSFGGEGTIHGCIVDIDFYNHIYLNPFDLTITPYSAEDVTEREVFKNVPSLLRFSCKELYSNYKKRLLLKKEFYEKALVIKEGQEIEKRTIKDDSNIYKISKVIKNMQYIFRYGIVRSWNEKILSTKESNKSLNDANLLLSFEEE